MQRRGSPLPARLDRPLSSPGLGLLVYFHSGGWVIEALRANPPTLVITAEFDPLRDEGDQYAARLAALGVPVGHVRFGGMFHGFFSMGDFLDDGRTAVALAAEALKVALDR